MKNLHYLKKFVVMVLAAMMTLSTFAMPTFAAKTNPGTTIKITGIDNNANVSADAYKVIKQDASGNWVNMYPEILTGLTIEDGKIKGDVKIKQTQIEALAKAAQNNQLNASKVEGEFDKSEANTLKKNLPNGANNKYGTENKTGAGMYLVLLTNDATDEAKTAAESTVRVYNPMVVSIDPSGEAGGWAAGEVGVTEVYNGTANVKSSKPAFDKYIAREDDYISNANNSKLTDADFANTTNLENSYATGEGKYGDSDTRGGNNDNTDPKVGSKVWFEITTTIPAYADNFWYTKGTTNYAPKFKIYDTLSEGLDLKKGTIAVYEKLANGNVQIIDPSKYELTAVDTAGQVNTFTINFKNEKPGTILGPQRDIVVRYAAVVNDNCKSNFDAEKNTARMEYTHKPGEEQSSKQITTYHYTFTINGRINGEDSTELREVVKVGSDKEGDLVFEETTAVTEKWTEDIQGAVFYLYKDNGNDAPDKSAIYRSAVSDVDGRLMPGTDSEGNVHKGLDRLDAGKYWLVEYSVPSPYKVKDTPIPVVIKANFNTDGTLSDYEIIVDNVVAGKYKAEYETVKEAKNNLAANDADAAEIRKPKTFQGHTGKDWTASKTAEQVATTNSFVGTKPTAPVRAEGETDEDWNARLQDYRDDLNAYYKTCNDPTVQAADIRNTKTGTLPSTGGMGTVLFTIGGALIMALALFILFGGKKKQQQK